MYHRTTLFSPATRYTSTSAGSEQQAVGARASERYRILHCLRAPVGGSLHCRITSVAGRIYMHLERRLAGATDALLFESAYSAERYVAQVGPPACAALVIPNGVGPDDFTASCANRDAADFLFVGE